MTGSELYTLLISHYKRLNPEFSTWEAQMSESLITQLYKSTITDLVFSRVGAGIGLEALRTTNLEGIEKALEIPAIQSKSLEIIEIMEKVDNWEEFQEKEKHPDKPPEKELTDFDKILKGMLKVSPPNKDKKQKEGE